MNMRLGSRDRRTLFIGAAAVGAIMVLGKGLPELRSWQAAVVAEASETHAQLAVVEQWARSAHALRDTALLRTGQLDGARSNLITAPSSEAVAALLSALIERTATEEGIDVQTITLGIDTTMRSEFVPADVRFSAEADVAGLTSFLLAMETQQTPILVRELSVMQASPAAPTSRAEALHVEMRLQTLGRVVRQQRAGRT